MKTLKAYKRFALAGVYGFVLILVLVYGRFGSDPFQEFRREVAGEDDDFYETAELPGPEDLRKRRCGQSCERIEDCGLLPDRDMCMPWCADEWTDRIQDCIAAADCDRIEEVCFKETDEEECAGLCLQLSACEWMTMDAGQCSEACLTTWTESQRECLLKAGCERSALQCIDLHFNATCAEVCEKFKGCDFIASGEENECVDYCESDMDDAARDCVVRRECDEIETQCALDQLPSELCLLACDAAVVCDLTATGEDECYLECEEKWDMELAICLAGQDNCEDAEKCLDVAGTQCVEICVRFVECAALEQWEYDMCVENCPAEFSDMERECLLDSPCADLDACLEAGSAVDDAVRRECSSACAKMSECELIDTTAQMDCGQTCIESWTLLKRNCVIQSDCADIASQCLVEDQEEQEF